MFKKKCLFILVLSLLGTLFFSETRGFAAASSPSAFQLKQEADRLLKEGRPEKAVPLYEKALQKDPHFANAHYNLATAHFLQGKISQAAESLESFVRLNPKDAEALYNLGCLHLRLGTVGEAQKCFRKAKRRCSEPLILQKTEEALQFLKDLRSQNPENQKLITYFLSL